MDALHEDGPERLLDLGEVDLDADISDAALERIGFKGGRLLEPSVGIGNFFGLMPTAMRNASNLHGVELDSLTSRMVAALYPKAKIAKATAFEDFDVPAEFFDVVDDPEEGDLTFSVDGGSGAGKSTLIKVLTGVETPDGGDIRLGGKKIQAGSVLEAQDLGISTVYQEVNLCPNLSVAENIFIGRFPMRGPVIDWAAMHPLPPPVEKVRERRSNLTPSCLARMGTIR